MINLTQQERDKFVVYLRQEAESDRVMLEQLGKIMSGPPAEALARKMKMRMAAYLIIAADLASIETETIQPESSP